MPLLIYSLIIGEKEKGYFLCTVNSKEITAAHVSIQESIVQIS
jgi:hypothetical protein